MMWFKKKFVSCAVCGVHFDPVGPSEERWGHLCQTHRAPVMDRDMRRDRVIRWATKQWLKLEGMMVEEQRKELDNQKQYSQAVGRCQERSMMQSYANQQAGNSAAP